MLLDASGVDMLSQAKYGVQMSRILSKGTGRERHVLEIMMQSGIIKPFHGTLSGSELGEAGRQLERPVGKMSRFLKGARKFLEPSLRIPVPGRNKLIESKKKLSRYKDTKKLKQYLYRKGFNFQDINDLL